MQHHLPRSVFLSACTVALALAPVGADEIRFERIPDGYANGVSDDGAVVVGERFGLEAFTWTLADGLVDIGGVSGISAGADGRRIVGNTSSIFGDSAARYDATAREAWLARGGSDVQLREGLHAIGAADSRILHFESMERAFGGFEDGAAGKEFQTAINSHLLGGWSATWCCTSWDKPRGTILFKRPAPLPSGTMARAAALPMRPPEVPAARPCYWRDCDANGHQK